MKLIYNLLLLQCSILLMLSNVVEATEDKTVSSGVDFVHYYAELEPSFEGKSLQGAVTINFIPKVNHLSELTFSAKYKQIKSVKLDGNIVRYTLSDRQLIISFENELQTNKNYTLKVAYSATPKSGMKFYDDHLFTVYHTQNWLVSHNDIADKATFELLLTHDAAMTTVGNGHLVSRKVVGNNKSKSKVISHWLQDTPMPTYIFGFAIGRFETVTLKTDSADISILYRENEASGLTSQLIKKAFVDVADMLSFFENKSGVPLVSNSRYKYVVVDGYMAQEASGFSLVGEKFVHTVLENESENWFMAHELAHEWWGNSITSSNFSHFWLNEGLVVFMVAAYKQHLFGGLAYKNEINVALKRIERAVKENRVAPVAFKHIIQEQNINRTMAYSKGAIVFYMLREKLGDELFWKALKQYTQLHKNNSVTTQDLKSAFEKTADTDLTPFFNKWVYGQALPTIKL